MNRAALLLLVLLVGCREVDDDDSVDDDDTTVGDDDDSTANTAPVAAITAPADGATLTDPSAVNLAGEAQDPEEGALLGAALQWSSDVDGPLGAGANLTVALSEGTHALTLLATDSGGLSASDSISVTVSAVNAPPQAFIDAPANNANSVEGETLVFEGRGVDPEDGDLAGSQLLWSSSLDGPLGSGATVSLSSPTMGDHSIVLTVVDSQGAQGLASITVHVLPLGQNIPPTVALISPSNGATYVAGDAVSLLGSATDPEDGILTGSSLEWTSSLDGALGAGGAVSVSALTVGTHTLTLTATDDDGASGSASVTISVNAPGNDPPVASISAPAPGFTAVAGSALSLVGSALDPEDGALSGAALTWSSDVDGALGSGSPLSVSSLSVGAHTLTLQATDSGGASGTAQTTVQILAPNAAPTVLIAAPNPGSSYDAGDPVALMGSGSDPEDGALSGSSLLWSSNVDGALGTGASLVVSSLSVGAHTITLTGVDSGGLSDSDAISLTVNPSPVNLPPNAILAGPGSGDVGVTLTFDGSASSDSDGAILTYAFDFGDGTVVSGAAASATHAFASAGSFTVTLTVTDDDGANDTDTLLVSIVSAVQIPIVVDPLGTYGAVCDLALDGADRVHVAYKDTLHSQLWYAWDDGNQWNYLLVDGPGFDQGGAVSDDIGLTVDAAGTPHFTYRFEGGPAGLRYATWTGSAWIREDATAGAAVDGSSEVAIALDPANGGRPTLGFTNTPSSSNRTPAVSYRTGPGAWTTSIASGGSSYNRFTDGMQFTAGGTLWLTHDFNTPSAVPWSSAAGWGTPEPLTTNDSTWASLAIDGVDQPIVMLDSSFFHRVGASWVSTSYEASEITYFDAATNAAGDLRMGLRHGSGLELGTPTPFWLYDYQGPMEATRFAVATSSGGLARACFFRSGNLMVF